MKRALLIIVAAIASTVVDAAADSTSVWNGSLRLGGIIKDETGDRTAVQETFNIHDGFALSSLFLNGRFNTRTHLRLDFVDVNLDNRRGVLNLRRSGAGNLRARYDESRYVFDPAGAVVASRRDFSSTLTLTPMRALWVSGDFGLQSRNGDRLGFPAGVVTPVLATRYDNDLYRYRVEAQARSSGVLGGTVAYDGVRLDDKFSDLNEREGHVVSAIAHVPGLVYDRLTHVLRGSIGRSELPASGVGYDLATIQYTAVINPWRPLRARYRFHGARVEDEADNDNRTDRYIHDADLETQWRFAFVSVGYGWEAWDDDRSVTTYDNLRAALTLRHPGDRVSARFAWSIRDKDDEEDATLLRDTEYARWDARLDSRPIGAMTAGGRVAQRTREMPDIGAEAEGLEASGYASYDYEHFGDSGVIASGLRVDYQFTDDEYRNREGDYHVASHRVTARLSADVFERIFGAAAVTYLSIEEDLDIDKSILSFELGYRFPRGFSADARYNVYNYDDYRVLDRYYTANVVWLNVGYAFSTE